MTPINFTVFKLAVFKLAVFKLAVFKLAFGLAFTSSLGCENRSVRVAAPSGDAQVLAAALVDDLRRHKLAAHRVECAGELDCSALLLSGDVDIAVLSTRTAALLYSASAKASTEGGPRLLATSSDIHIEKVVASDLLLNTIDQLRVRAVSLRVAMQAEYAARADGGFATLSRAYGLSRATRVRFDDDHQSLAALERGEVDVAIVEKRSLSASHKPLNDPRGVLTTSRLAFVAFGAQGVADDSDVRASATRIGAEVAPIASIALIVPPATESELRVPIRSITRALEDKTTIAILRPGDPLPDGPRLELRFEISESESANAVANNRASAHAPKQGDALVTFDSGSGPPLTLLQHGDLFDRTDAAAILKETAIARIPRGPSIWTRARKGAPARKPVNNPWLDSLLNLSVMLFCIWLVVSIFRRSNMPVPDNDNVKKDKQTADSD